MDQEFTAPLINKRRRHKNYLIDKNYSFQSPRKQSVRIRQQSLIESQQEQFCPINKVQATQLLQWQKSDLIQLQLPQAHQIPTKNRKKRTHTVGWFGTSQKPEEKYRINDMFFKLKPRIQKVLYFANYILNAAIRVMFINLLVFLGLINRWTYLEVFLSLYLAAIIIYFTVMVKMLFTRSDKASIYCQKIFNQTEWSDIQSQRLMGSHFNLGMIMSKITVFFNPFTKFEKNIKISFLRQELFKRMELILVFIPFSFTFFIRQNDFISEGRPNFNVYITGAICLQSIRTAVTYLCVYIYS